MAIEILDTGPGVNISLQGLAPTLTEFTRATVPTATVTVNWTVPAQSAWPTFPAGTKIGNYRVQINGGGLAAPLVQSVAPPGLQSVFVNVPLDDPPAPAYTASVQLMMADGVTPMGPAQVSPPFSALSPIPAPVPNGVSVTVTVP